MYPDIVVQLAYELTYNPTSWLATEIELWYNSLYSELGQIGSYTNAFVYIQPDGDVNYDGLDGWLADNYSVEIRQDIINLLNENKPNQGNNP